jgi:hypothetical protein
MSLRVLVSLLLLIVLALVVVASVGKEGARITGARGRKGPPPS